MNTNTNNTTKLDLPTSVITRYQKQFFTKEIMIDDKKGRIECVIRFDDECKNGHNSFSITGSIYSSRKSDADRYHVAGGCIHEEIEQYFPEFKHLIKWHLCSTDAPLHYVANTTYHARGGKLEYARDTAIWQDATIEQLQDEELLLSRLPNLMQEFKKDIEAQGFIY